MRKGLYILIWFMFFLITGCGDADVNANTDPDDRNYKDQNDVQKPVKTVGSVAVTGQIMLGPVMLGNSLKAEVFDKENNSLGTSAVSSHGIYDIKLEDHNGPFIILVYSKNPKQCSGTGDYIDEATGAPKCFGNRYLLSASFVNTGEVTSSVNLEVHSSPATTIAAFHAGIDINENGGLSIPNNLSKEIIAESNKAVAQVLGLGVKPITEIKPTSHITSDKKFKQGDAYASALAMISGVEAVNNGQSPNDLLRQISKGITTDNNSPKLDPTIQDILVKGLHKVADKIKEISTDTSILEVIMAEIDNAQDNYPDSLYTVDLTKDLPKPQFTNSNKTSNLQPVWQWQSGDSGAGTFKYKFDDQTQWTVTTSNIFTPMFSLKPGIYKLEVREIDQSGEWGLAIESVIEIVANNEGTVSIDGKPKQGENLTAKPNDLDGITSAINYSWFADGQLITNINNSQYLLSEFDVGKRIKVVIDYTDALGAQETAMVETDIILTNTESVVEITIPVPDNNSPPQAVSHTQTTEFPVCWGEKIDEISDEKLRIFKDMVKQLLIESWSKYAMVDFIGWDDCKTDSKEITNILFSRSGPNYYFGKDNIIVFNAGTVNYLNQYTIVHEFGHLLGFSHEQDRLDTYRYGGLGRDNHWYNNYCDSMEPGGPRVTDGFSKKYLAELENDYDPYSIMNYCSKRLRYSSSSAFKGKLSLLDIDEVRKKYGTRSDTILTIEGKPMTGFYNDGSGEYEYYEHGVIASLGRDTVFSLPKQPIVGSYKNISHKNGMNSLVDLSRQKSTQSGIYIPLADHLISICSYSQNSISSDTLTSFENCKNFDENDYVGYRSYYFNSRENTYNQVMKSFCQELRGDQTPWDSEQFFVSLTNCVELADYFIGSSGKRLYFNGIGYTGRINELEHQYFIDGVLYEDEYKFDGNILTKKPFRDELPAYKQVNDNIQMNANFYGIYDGLYYLNGVQADDYEFVSEWDSDNFEITNIFSLISGKLYKNHYAYLGYNPSKLQNHNGYYFSGDYVPEENYIKVGQDIYFIAENKSGSNYSDMLYKNGVGLTGFNSSILGNGINSYYASGFPTTILCENNSSSSCSDEDDSVEEIYQKFKDINSYDIFAWINVVTQYSLFGENLYYEWQNINSEDVAPILFKGNNPFTGVFDGINYKTGYPE